MIALRPMREDEFDAWFEYNVEESTIETAKSFEIDLDRARRVTREQLTHHLADKLQTKNHYLFVAERHEEGVQGVTPTKIGYLWFSINEEERYGWLDNIELLEEFRGQGLGGQLLELLQDELSKRGIHSVSLHVAAHNERARKLYEKSGFKFTGHYMKKDW